MKLMIIYKVTSNVTSLYNFLGINQKMFSCLVVLINSVFRVQINTWLPICSDLNPFLFKPNPNSAYWPAIVTFAIIILVTLDQTIVENRKESMKFNNNIFGPTEWYHSRSLRTLGWIIAWKRFFAFYTF